MKLKWEKGEVGEERIEKWDRGQRVDGGGGTALVPQLTHLVSHLIHFLNGTA